MKTLFLWMMVLTIAYVSKAQNVNIPDANFKNALISAGIDTSGDGEISYAEAEAITNLSVFGKHISDMTGIEAFINLDSLDCRVNQYTNLDVSNNTTLVKLLCGSNLGFTSLDVTNCTALKYLNCDTSQLTSLDVSGNTALTELYCSENYGLISLDVSNNTNLSVLSCFNVPLTSLDVSNNTSLTYLNCSYDQLSSLDVSNNVALTFLACSYDLISSLDVSNNTALMVLYCNSAGLTSLDVSNNTALIFLDCQNNLFTGVDVSNNTSLETLYCGGINLTSLNVSGNTALRLLRLHNSYELLEVCLWEPDSVTLDTLNIPNCQFTTDCSETAINTMKENSTIDIYPNPSADIINIEIENINDATIEIYNVSGMLILKRDHNSKVEKIDISGLSVGEMYFIKVRQGNNVRVEKMIVH